MDATPMTWQQHTLATCFGLLGNLISLAVFLSSVPTFITIRRTRSTQNYPSLPYLVAFFSCVLWLYYGFLLTDGILIISINAVGCVIETVYIVLYIVYAPRHTQRLTLMLMAMNVGLVLSIFLAIHFTIAKKHHVMVLGWICTSVSIAVFAAPLSVMVQVIRTRSVQYMPLAPSVSLIVSATVWFCYGFFAGDINIYIPNVIGLTLGIIQVLLYTYYRWAADRETDVEGAVVQEDMRGGGESLVDSAPVLELVEVGGRLVEIAEGQAPEGREVEDAEGGSSAAYTTCKRLLDDFSTYYPEAKRVKLSDGKKGKLVLEKVIIEEENVSNPVVAVKERRKFFRAKRYSAGTCVEVPEVSSNEA